MENPKDQLADSIKDANNVLVTVSTNPSVDQLSAAIGLTLFLSKLKKHSTTVFSGQIPSTMEFLKPEETIEGNTDSLQDFIIALDKAKADKIRYKVEDTMVKIFITPYRTSIGEDDLVFSKGDFNVDVVIALGVHEKGDLDQAITAHGRILHDATVTTVNTMNGSELGTINWTDPQASSLCEMIVVLSDMLKPNSLDAQIATALLTGIVAETERFSNERTSSATMNASAKLMAAGANQQLVATKLEEHVPEPQLEPKSDEEPEEGGGHVSDDATDLDDGALRISHDENAQKKEPEILPDHPKQELPPVPPPPPPEPTPKPEPPAPEKSIGQIHINEEGQLAPIEKPAEPSHIETEHRKFLGESPTAPHDGDIIGGSASQNLAPPSSGTDRITEPPSMGGKLTASGEDMDEDTSPFNMPASDQPILRHDAGEKQSNTLPPEPPPQEPPQDTPPPQNLVQAAEPPPPPLPLSPPTPQAMTPDPDAALKPAPASEPKEEESMSKLPTSFISTLDDRTLKDIEKATHSPHRTHLADDLTDKTLNTIEETVHSPHRKQAVAVVRPEQKNIDEAVPSGLPLPKPADDVLSAFQYESHESEPPEAKDGGQVPVTQQPSDGKPVDVTQQSLAADATSSVTPASGQPADDNSGKKAAESVVTKPEEQASSDTEAARHAVLQAINTGGDGRSSLPPIEALGASDFGVNLHGGTTDTVAQAAVSPPPPPSSETSRNIEIIDDQGKITFQQPGQPKPPLPDHTSSPGSSPQAPPPVPPPLMPPHDEA